ncbi:MAG: ABC transporter ATP-binding protein [Romboutsia sp.]
MKNILKLFKHIKFNYINKQLVCFVFLILNTALSLIFPYCFSLVIDQGISSKNIEVLFKYIIIIFLIGILMIVVSYIQSILYIKLGKNISKVLKEEVFLKIYNSNYIFWNENKIGDVFTSLTSDINVIENLLSVSLAKGFLNIFTLVGLTIILLKMNWIICIAIFALAIVFAIFQKNNGEQLKHQTKQLRDDIGEMNSFTNEFLMNIQAIQLMYDDNIINKYNQLNRKNYEQYILQAKKGLNGRIYAQLFSTLALSVSLLIGAINIINGSMSVGILFSIVLYIQRIYDPIISLGSLYVSIKSCQPVIQKVLNLLEHEQVISSGSVILPNKIDGKICLENISFSYPDSKSKVFDNLNINFKQGKITGIIGENGSGKSTLIRLISKACKPNTGTITIDGINIHKYDNKFLKSQVGYLIQNPTLMSGDISNIFDFYNSNNLSKEAESIGIVLDKISKVGENSNFVSGGEIQKISLLRLLLQDNKSIYILDEPTSAVDIENEIKICNKLKEVLKGKTVIIITHRPAILDICDEIINLDEKKYENRILKEYI